MFLMNYLRYLTEKTAHSSGVLAIIALISIVIIKQNWFLVEGVFLSQDFAATSIGVHDLLTFNQFNGTPSWNNYNHPGPAWMLLVLPAELILSALKINHSAAKSMFFSKLLLNATSLWMFWIALRGLYGEASAFIAWSFMCAWLLCAPRLLAQTWEPQVGAIFLLIAFSTIILSISNKQNSQKSYIFTIISGISCSFLFQIQLSFIFASFILSCIFIVYSRSLKHIFIFKLGVFFGSTFMIVDFFYYDAKNLLDYLAHARLTADRPRIGIERSIAVVGGLAMPTALAHSFFLGFVVISLGCIIVSGRAGRVMSGEGIAAASRYDLLAAMGISMIASAFLFYMIAANVTYAPDHVGVYVYPSVGALLCVVIARCAHGWALNDRFFVLRAGAITLTCLALMVTNNKLSSSDIGFVRKEGLQIAIDQAQTIHVRLGISVKFAPPPPSPTSVLERELPWSVAVGFANELRRRGVQYCYVGRGGAESYADQIMVRFMKTESCSDGQIYEEFEFVCIGGTLLARSRYGNFPIRECS